MQHTSGSSLYVGTRDGLFLFDDLGDRQRWSCRGPFLAGQDVAVVAITPAAIYLGTNRGEVYQTFEDAPAWTRLASDLPGVRVVRPGNRRSAAQVRGGRACSLLIAHVFPSGPSRGGSLGVLGLVGRDRGDDLGHPGPVPPPRCLFAVADDQGAA